MVVAVVAGTLQSIDLLLGGELMAKACGTTSPLLVAIEDKGVLPIHPTSNVTRPLKVVSNRQITKNSLPWVAGSINRTLHLLFVLRAGRIVAMVRLVAIGQRLDNLLIVGVVDG